MLTFCRHELIVEMNEYFIIVQLCCPKCGNWDHRIDRRVYPELTLGGLINRVLKLHGPHMAGN